MTHADLDLDLEELSSAEDFLDYFGISYDPAVVHEVIAVSDADSFAMTRRLALEEGILVGGSSGMAVVAALRLAATLGPDDTVVVRPMMYLALSYDHRIIDGREAVLALVAMKEALEDPARLTLEI